MPHDPMPDPTADPGRTAPGGGAGGSAPQGLADARLALARRLTEVAPGWAIWKNAESALAGRGDIDAIAPPDEHPAIWREFHLWAGVHGLGPVLTCPHLSGSNLLVAVGADGHLEELQLCSRAVFRGSALFRAEDLHPLLVMDDRGYRRLRPGAEGLFLLLHNGMARGGRPSTGLAEKGIPELLRRDPQGVEAAAALLGRAAGRCLDAARAAAAGGWDRVALVEVELWAAARSILDPRLLASRSAFRLAGDRNCTVLSCLRKGRRVPGTVDDFLRSAARNHRFLGELPPESGTMRVAHFVLGRCNPESPNGVDKTVYHLSRSQASLGLDVGVFCLTAKPPIPIPGVEVKAYPPRVSAPLLPLPSSLRDILVDRSPFNLPSPLVDDLLSWEPDVVHLHYVQIPQNVVLGSRLRKAGIPYCVTTHGGLAGPALRRRRVLKMAFGRLFERPYLEHANFVHAVSGVEAHALREYGVTRAIVVARNGVDVGTIPRPAERDFPSERNGGRMFLYLGRLDPEQKGLDLLLRAWAQTAARQEHALALVGPDWRGGRTALERLAKDLHIEGSTRFAGPAFGEEKWRFLFGCHVFVHPSRWEGMPFSLYEAMAAGRPVITTPAVDAEHLIEAAGAGIVAAASPEAIASSIDTLAKREAVQLGEMGARARALVRAEFGWERTAQRIVDAYRAYAGAERWVP